MLAPGNYVQCKSRIKRYIDTKPNHELIHYCLKNPPYKFPWADKEVPISEGSSVATTETYTKNYKNVSQDIRDQLNAEAEAVQIILTGIDNDIYSRVDACPNACEMWKAIERLKQEWQRSVTLVMKSQELTTVSYHKLYDILKQHQNEVNELRAERIARTANPLALVAQQQPVYHPKNQPTHYTQNSSTRSQQPATKNRGKAIVNSPQPIYDEEPSMDNSPRINRGAGYNNQRLGHVTGARETVEQADWRDDTDDESKDQELEAHYMYMTQIQENDNNDDLAKERELIASLIKKLKCEIDDSKNHNKFLETSNKVLVEKLKGDIEDFKNKNKSLESSKNHFKEENNILLETNALMYNDLKKFQAELDRRNDMEYASKVEIDCAKAKRDSISYKMESQKLFNKYTQTINVLNQTISKMKKELCAHLETISILSQAKEYQIKLYKTREDKELDKGITLENKVKVLDNIVYKTDQSIQTMNMLNSKCQTSFVKLEFLKKAQSVNPRLNVRKCECLEKELSKSKMMTKSFESLQKHAINLEIDLQQCQEKMKNDKSFKENQSKEFCKEREQYFENQDLKAQLQDKGIAISEMKKLIEKLKGKYVDAKFVKSSVIRQPNAFKSQRPLILGKPTIFSNSLERKDFSKLKPQLKSNPIEDRVMLNNSQGKKQEVEDHRRNVKLSKNKTYVTAYNDILNAKTLIVNFVCATCGKCVLNEKHDMCVLKFVNGVNSRTKMPIDVPVSTREPKRTVKQPVAKPHRKIVASESTNQKPRNTFRKLYEHVSKACSWWYPKFTPPNWKPKSEIGNVEPYVSMPLGNASRTANILEPMTSRRFTLVEIILFIVDSGCSKHMTGNLKLLINFMEKFLGMMKFGNDQIAPILGYGDLVQGAVTIKRVYYVEGLNHSLFSVGQFCDANLEVAFRKSMCYIRDLKGNDLLTGSHGTDLYSITLQDTTSPNPICLMAKATSSQAWLWHRRLSHLNFNTINLLSKNDIVVGLPKLKFIKDHLYSSYELGKAKRKSFQSKTTPSSKRRLQLLHMDLCGPMRVESINGKKYVLKSIIKRYIDTKPNHELIHYCLKNPPYKFTWADKEVPTSEGSYVTTTETYMETYKNVSQDIRDQLNDEAEAVQIILTGIDNDIYSTVDACPNAFLTSSTPEWQRIARTANPLALVAQQQPVYHPQNYPAHYTLNSSTRSQQPATRNRGKVIVNSPQPIYDQEPSMVAEDDETSKDKDIDKLMALISISFKKINKPANNNLQTSSNTSRANQDNSPRINRSIRYENQRIGNVAGAWETVAREFQKPKRVKDAAYHKEKMLLCKQEEAGIQLNAEQANWRDDTDDESEDQELEAHYMYMAQLQEVSPDAADFGSIFDSEPMQKVLNNDNYNVFAIESEHPEQSESVHDTYPIEQDEHNVIIDSLDMSYDKEQIDQNDDDNDLANEHPFIQNTIEANFSPEIQKINADLEKFHVCLKEEMVVDLRYFNSLKLEVDYLKSQLETQKTQFLNKIDRLSREYYYADHMNAILGMYTELDEVTNLQCDYLELLEKCECLEKELSKNKMMSKSFETLQKHAINLEIDLQQC
nr:retrovirus-related Pol polyprotein from transposon TNT 1-94 [Tanacetum cinerariifolium]